VESNNLIDSSGYFPFRSLHQLPGAFQFNTSQRLLGFMTLEAAVICGIFMTFAVNHEVEGGQSAAQRIYKKTSEVGPSTIPL
jgi:hypothetical protein